MGKGGKGKGVPFKKESKWQIEMSGEWKDYEAPEDAILKRAFLVGQPNARMSTRGQDYEYNFAGGGGKSMIQKNMGSKKERKIRPPFRMFPPKSPLLPPGPMIVLAIPAGNPTSIEIDDPNNPGQRITVAIPPGAKPGAKIAVPVPQKGQNIAEVVEKQRGWSTGAKVAAGAAAVGALAVGGVVLGEHLSGGALSAWAEPGLEVAGDFAAGAADHVGDWAGGAVDTLGDAAGDVGDWAGGAAGDVGDWAGGAGDWAGGAAGDVGDWAGGAADDVGDWLGDATGDVGDFITDLF